MLDVNGRTKVRGNAYFDSLIQSLSIRAQSAHFSVVQATTGVQANFLHVNHDAHVNGIFTAGSIGSGRCAVCSGAAGNIISIDGEDSKISSSTGIIDFGNTNLTTTGNVSSTNISSLQTATDNNTSHISILNTQISGITSSQWATNPLDSSLSFNGNVFVKNLNATEGISIGSFRFSNGGILPVPVIRDTIRSPHEIVVRSGAEKLSLAANQVEAQQQLGVGKTPGAGVALDVNGSIQATGNISSTSITTAQLTINGGSVRADTLRANNSLSVNHSLLLAKENTNNYAEVSTIDANVALVLQKDSTGSGVGIGITPYAGEKLSVSGNVGIENGNLRLSNLSGTGDRQVVVDASGNLKQGNPVPEGFDQFWRTDGNVTVGHSYFLGTTDAADLIVKTNNNEVMRITSSGNVGIGTISPQANFDVAGTSRFADDVLFPIKGTTSSKATFISEQGDAANIFSENYGSNLNRLVLESIDDGNADYTVIRNTHYSAGSKDVMEVHRDFVSIDGNVGIGTTSPIQTLDVNGRINLSSGVIQKGGTAITNTGDLGLYSMDPNTYMRFVTNGQPFRFSADANPQSTNPLFTIESNGNVGIGTSLANNPNNYKLAVAGKIGSKEDIIIEELSSTWYDFVFESGYERMNYMEKELFVKKYKHLPGIESEKEIVKNGLSMGKTLAGITMNVEENTLDIIELYKMMDELKQENEELKTQLSSLKKK